MVMTDLAPEAEAMEICALVLLLLLTDLFNDVWILGE